MKKLLERSRYLSYIGIISLLIAAFAAYLWGILRTANAIQVMIVSLGKAPGISIEFIEVIDSFLIATTLLIFSVSMYELFIGDLELPDWMLAHNLYELKAKLSSMIVLVIGIKFLQKMLETKDAQKVLYIGIAASLMAAVLIAFGYFGKKD